LRANDTNFIIGMINLLDGEDARAKAKALLRRFLKRFKAMPDYRRIALRLSRAIFEDCPKIERPFDATGRTLGMLARTPAEPAAKGFVEYAARTLQRFDGLFDTDISRAQSREVVARLRALLTGKKPFSFIRVGDGEGNALAYDSDIARFADSDAAEREAVWWGRALDPAQREALGARVLAAMQDADGLGIPALERILRDIKLERREYLGSTRAGRGVRTVLRALEEG